MSPARYAWRGSLFWIINRSLLQCALEPQGRVARESPIVASTGPAPRCGGAFVVLVPGLGSMISDPCSRESASSDVPVLDRHGCVCSWARSSSDSMGLPAGRPVTGVWPARPLARAIGHISRGICLCLLAICVPMSLLPGVVLFAPRSSVSLLAARVHPLRWLVHREPGCGIAAVRMLAFARRRSFS